MDKSRENLVLRDCVDVVSVRLESLYSALEVVHFGLEKQGIQKQALDCMECITCCVHDICCYITEQQNNLKEMNRQCNNDNEDVPL